MGHFLKRLMDLFNYALHNDTSGLFCKHNKKFSGAISVLYPGCRRVFMAKFLDLANDIFLPVFCFGIFLPWLFGSWAKKICRCLFRNYHDRAILYDTFRQTNGRNICSYFCRNSTWNNEFKKPKYCTWGISTL